MDELRGHRYAHRLIVLEERNLVWMPWTQIGATDVHYEDRGSGPPLVFIHGALSSAETWYRHVDEFSQRYRVLAYDSVNHGLSSNSPRGEREPDRADELEGFLS